MENGFDLLTSSLVSFLQELVLDFSWENLYFDIWLPTSKVS